MYSCVLLISDNKTYTNLNFIQIFNQLITMYHSLGWLILSEIHLPMNLNQQLPRIQSKFRKVQKQWNNLHHILSDMEQKKQYNNPISIVWFTHIKFFLLFKIYVSYSFVDPLVKFILCLSNNLMRKWQTNKIFEQNKRYIRDRNIV